MSGEGCRVILPLSVRRKPIVSRGPAADSVVEASRSPSLPLPPSPMARSSYSLRTPARSAVRRWTGRTCSRRMYRSAEIARPLQSNARCQSNIVLLQQRHDSDVGHARHHIKGAKSVFVALQWQTSVGTPRRLAEVGNSAPERNKGCGSIRAHPSSECHS